MRCKATFNVNKPPHFHRPVKCELPLDHKGWHEYGTTMWEPDEKKPLPARKP